MEPPPRSRFPGARRARRRSRKSEAGDWLWAGGWSLGDPCGDGGIGKTQSHVTCLAGQSSCGQGLARGRLHEDITALECALRVVGGQCEREPLELVRVPA